MNKDDQIYVAGGGGLVGSAIIRRLEAEGYRNICYANSAELDLRDEEAVQKFFNQHRPDYVFMAAARVGGIYANSTFPAEFIRDNLAIQTNLIHASYLFDVKKLLFLGSSCIYPREAPQPMKEDCLLTGPLEPTNEAYAVAKIAGIKMCQAYRRQYGRNFICAMPTNVYGPNDNFDPLNSHVIPGMIQRFWQAKVNGDELATCWGSGRPIREFIHSDDLASACLHLMRVYDEEGIINVGTGHGVSLDGLAGWIARIVGYQGEIAWDTSRPDGAPEKVLDLTRLYETGWNYRITLQAGLTHVCQWYAQEFGLQPETGGDTLPPTA